MFLCVKKLLACLQTGAPGWQPGRPHHAQHQLRRGNAAPRGAGRAGGAGGAGGEGRVAGGGKGHGEGADTGGGDERHRQDWREAQELLRPAAVQHGGEPPLQRRDGDGAGAEHRAELRYEAEVNQDRQEIT